jgi:hypothetical protein
MFMQFVRAALLFVVATSPALAQTGPVIVVPSRPDIPIYENGIDISWTIVESELGLARPGVLTPTVVYRFPPPVIVPYARASYAPPGYFPSTGKPPGYGRLEEVPGPDRPLPPPAQSYRKSWSSSSAPLPADLPQSGPGYGPMYISPVIAPSFNGGGGHHRPWGNGPGQGRPPNGGPPAPPGGAGAPGAGAQGQSFSGPPGGLPPAGGGAPQSMPR